MENRGCCRIGLNICRWHQRWHSLDKCRQWRQRSKHRLYHPRGLRGTSLLARFRNRQGLSLHPADARRCCWPSVFGNIFDNSMDDKCREYVGPPAIVYIWRSLHRDLSNTRMSALFSGKSFTSSWKVGYLALDDVPYETLRVFQYSAHTVLHK